MLARCKVSSCLDQGGGERMIDAHEKRLDRAGRPTVARSADAERRRVAEALARREVVAEQHGDDVLGPPVLAPTGGAPMGGRFSAPRKFEREVHGPGLSFNSPRFRQPPSLPRGAGERVECRAGERAQLAPRAY